MRRRSSTPRRPRSPWRLAAALAIFLPLLAPTPSTAQLSPGRLARAHTDLEGTSHCLDCHSTGKGVDPARCLDCHSLLRQEIEAGKGLHAGSDYRACERCHIEHHGEEFELVFWGDRGAEAFDHHEAGFVLEGAHARLTCRGCHKPELIGRADLLRRKKKDLLRTYMGLGTTCLSCHSDLHDGQFQERGCTDCHGQESWKPADGFDHRESRYPLTGAHVRVACERCHPAEPTSEPGVARIRYRGIAAGWCGDCHRDPHAGRLGNRCQSCHQTASWKTGAEQTFEHERTRYPLRGRHRTATCESCHRGDLLARISDFDQCASCHADQHRGQFLERRDRGACDACHDLQGFSPPRYGLTDHQESTYPLEGSHLAVPCIACHRPVSSARLRQLRPVDRKRAPVDPEHALLRYQFASTRCRECHADPHRGALDRYMATEGCTACHDLGSWYTIRFDHRRAELSLNGAHARVDCRKCHTRVVLTGRRDSMVLSDLPKTCVGCHDDPHQGQLLRPGVDPRCTRCHTEDNWRATRFVHDRDAAFKLEGAHVRVPCADCHAKEIDFGRPVVRYRPLETACAACHKTDMEVTTR